MCGRFAQGEASMETLAELTGRNTESLPMKTTKNFAPGMTTAILVKQGEEGREAIPAIWGLIPSWQAKAGDKPNHFAMFNARAESVLEKPSFKELIRSQKSSDTGGRCVLIMDGYYEWDKSKQPFYVHLRTPALVAGLYQKVAHAHASHAHAEDVPGVDARRSMTTFTILTTGACERFCTLHPRQPVFLTREQVDLYLNPSRSQTVTDAVTNADTQYLQSLQDVQRNTESGLLQTLGKWYAVSPKVGNTKYQGDDCNKEWLRTLNFSRKESVCLPKSNITGIKQKVEPQISEQSGAASSGLYLKRDMATADAIKKDTDADSAQPNSALLPAPKKARYTSPSRGKVDSIDRGILNFFSKKEGSKEEAAGVVAKSTANVNHKLSSSPSTQLRYAVEAMAQAEKEFENRQARDKSTSVIAERQRESSSNNVVDLT